MSHAPAVPPTTTLTDPAEVFKKALWRRPTPGDKILHAERREWADAAGLKKWQWFLVLEPSESLIKYLRHDNAFILHTAPNLPPLPSDAPAWFQHDRGETENLRSTRGGMSLSFTKANHTLYAHSSGGGFTPGAPEPDKSALTSNPSSTGRLPLSSPPNPSSP